MSSQPPYGSIAPQGKTKVLGLDYSVAGLLCYLPPCLCLIDVIAAIIWLATEPKENRLLRFHALQSLLLFGVGIVVGIVFRILGVGIAFTSDSAVGFGGAMLLGLVQLAIWVILLIIYIVGMVKAYQLQMWKIPLIGDIAEKNC